MNAAGAAALKVLDSKVGAVLIQVAVLYGVWVFIIKPYFNPGDRDNVANTGANALFHALGGNPTDTIGTALYGSFHSDPLDDDPTVIGSAAWRRAHPGASPGG